MKKKIAIGVLAYDVEKYIEQVLTDLSQTKEQLYVIDDSSNDNTLEILENFQPKVPMKIIRNKKNIGAGASTRKLIEVAKSDGYDMILKVDGDGQFIIQDVIKILDIASKNNYKYIKSNRFWEGGIKGNIPKKRFFGNLLATMFLQVTTGTNKLYDPLNGLFAISTSVISDTNFKYYPKRYGYPYYFSVSAIINGYETYQINNVVIYNDQSSNLRSTIVLFTIIKLSIIYYFKKIKIKKNIGLYQRSAFLDLTFIISFILTLYLLIQLIYTVYFANVVLIRSGNLLIILIFSILFNIFIFIASFKEEKSIRNTYIYSEN
jgi:GT2 family glycosyltransferase